MMEAVSLKEEKKQLREQMKRQLSELPEGTRKAQDKVLFRAFLGLDAVKAAGTVMVYWGVGNEASTTDLISALLACGKRVVLPRCMPGRMMETRAYRGGRLVRSPYGIPEPGEDCPMVAKQEIDVVLVPALCCDRQGYRLGKGGGYYDRWLTDYTGISVSMCYRELLQERLPREEHDRPVKLLLSVE